MKQIEYKLVTLFLKSIWLEKIGQIFRVSMKRLHQCQTELVNSLEKNKYIYIHINTNMLRSQKKNMFTDHHGFSGFEWPLREQNGIWFQFLFSITMAYCRFILVEALESVLSSGRWEWQKNSSSPPFEGP